MDEILNDVCDTIIVIVIRHILLVYYDFGNHFYGDGELAAL